MLDQETFFKEHYIDPEEFRACGISWEELCAIYDSYVSIEEHLRDLGKDFVDAYLYDIEKAGIHSYRYRTKDPEHLLEKIIRKRSEDPERFADIDRYNYHIFYFSGYYDTNSSTGKTGSISIATSLLYLRMIRGCM